MRFSPPPLLNAISASFHHYITSTPLFLLLHCSRAFEMGRPPCCDKANVKRGLWTAEEDAKILAYVANHGTGNWTLVPKKAGLNRCGKSCRLRWTNYLRPDLKHEGFSPQEEDLIVELHRAVGSRWSLIAKQLPGRTDNDVKNYWNTKLKKKLMKMGIDPITHKPFSQIFSDYNNVTHQNQQMRPPARTLTTSILTQAQPPSFPSLPPPAAQPTMVPIPGHFHDHSFVELQSPDFKAESVALFDDASSSSSSSSTNNWSGLFGGLLGGNEAAEAKGAVESETSSSCPEASSFVKEMLDRDIELQLDLLALNEFLEY